MRQLIERVHKWADNRGIFEKGTVYAQAEKTVEEAEELAEAVQFGDDDGIVDGIGDVMVTLIIQAKLQGLDIETCLESVLMEIENRKGTMVNGTFVKNV